MVVEQAAPEALVPATDTDARAPQTAWDILVGI